MNIVQTHGEHWAEPYEGKGHLAGGGITRSNGKWSKELAIMDNGLIGKRSNWIML